MTSIMTPTRALRALLMALAAALLSLVVTASSTAAPACTTTFDGGAGTSSWHDAANWTTDAVPGPSDHVCIPNVSVNYSTGDTSILSLQSQGTLELTGGSLSLTDATNASTTVNLTQSGFGTIGGAGTLTVSGGFNWSGGTQTDAGTTVIASGATLSIDTDADNVFLSGGRTLQIDSGATASWSGQFGIGLAGAATIENAGTFNANGGVLFDNGGGELIHNAATGTFSKSAGPATLTVRVPFDNDGTVEAAAGTLSFNGGDAGSTTGDFNGSGADGLVRFTAGTYTLETGVSLSGRIELTNTATLNVSGTVPITSGATFTQSGFGTIGGTGTLTVSGGFNWSGGTQTDAGTTVIASGATLSIDTAADNVFLSGGRTLQIDSGATASWSGQFGIGLAGAATIENAGTFNANGGDSVFDNGGGELIHNAATGTFSKSAGPATLTVRVPFDNDGTVEAAAGTLSFNGGDAGSTTGDFNGSGADGLVRFTAGTYTLETSVSLSGRIELTNTATLNVSGTVPITSGATFTQSGFGTIGGTGTLTVSGGFDWSGGTQTDAGTTVIASGATLSIDTDADNVFLSGGRTLQIDSGATASWSGQFGIGLAGAATIENAGTFNANGGVRSSTTAAAGSSTTPPPAPSARAPAPPRSRSSSPSTTTARSRPPRGR